MADVSIIIVNYNTLSMTNDCIESVIEKTSGLDYEIILVDNASTDGSKEFFSNKNHIKYIYNDDNLGFGRANNKGIEVAHGRNILFLNSDTLLRNNAIKILCDYLDNNPDVGACGSNLFDKDGSPTFSYERFFPSIFEEVNYLFEGRLKKYRFKESACFNHTESPLKVAFISGANLMVRKSVLDETGFFNERFFLYYEETELCLRIHRKGYLIMSVPNAEITHFCGKSTGDESDIHICRMETSRRIFYDLSYSKPYTAFANAVRRFHLCMKLMSPYPSTRKRWKHRKELLKNI